MRLLLDTHFAIWLIEAPARLKRRERDAIFGGDTKIILSAISVWEVRIKWMAAQRSNRIWRVPPAAIIAFAERNEMVIEPLTAAAAAAPDATLKHGDPFDEMLIAHAGYLGARLLTRDDKLIDHPLAYQP